MHIAVFLGALEDAQRLFVGDIAALACLDAVSCKGADRYTQLLLKLAAALAHKAHCITAGAVAYTELSLILLSQWEICSMLTDSLVAGMAFSTGITCMPMLHLREVP